MKVFAHTQKPHFLIDQFHSIVKRGIVKVAEPVINDISHTTNNLYPNVESRNANIFKEILDEAMRVDGDDIVKTATIDENKRHYSTAKTLGLSRKEFWTLMAKFFVVLYDSDNYYSERIDFILRKMVERKDEFYFDEQSLPENWYPNRKPELLAAHFAKRNLSLEQQGQLNLFLSKEERSFFKRVFRGQGT